jgi:cytochrome c oxidase subunit 1
MTTAWQERTLVLADRPEERSVVGWFTSRDHKRIGLITIGTSFLLFLAMGSLALVMRAQLSQPRNRILGPRLYDQFFTIHGSGMIYFVVTPIALGLGVYLVPLHVGAPVIAAPRATLLGYWLYLLGAVTVLSGFLTSYGAASSGWYAYLPLSDSEYTQGPGQDLWIFGIFLSTIGMILMAGTVLWTALRMRAPQMSMLRISVFTWSMIVTCLMVLMSFPSLLLALGMQGLGRVDPSIMQSDSWDIAYQHLFWFFGHPVVYIMFFPFVGAVAEVLATFAGRKFFGYSATVMSLLAFAALSMSVWGHHMLTTGQAANDYYSLTSTLLAVPAGIEYFGFLATILLGKLVYRTPMLFALAFIPQFLIGGLTGIMVGSPALDAHVHATYFIVAHFHYTLFAGSVFGLFAGLYFWFPKMTGLMYSERLGRTQFVLMTVGTNVAFLPMFFMGYFGMTRRVSNYDPNIGLNTLNLISSIGAFIIGISILVLLYNLVMTFVRRVPAPDDPWGGHTLEWVTASPPARFNFDAAHALPAITSYAPLLDERMRSAKRNQVPT